MLKQSNSGVSAYNLSDEIVRGIIPLVPNQSTPTGKGFMALLDEPATATCIFMDGSSIIIQLPKGFTLLPFAIRQVNIEGCYNVC